MNMRSYIVVTVFMLLASFSMPFPVVAQTTGGNPNSNTTLLNPLKAQNLEAFLGDILSFVIRIGMVIVILMLVYVGYLFVAAQGKEAEITKARRALLWTVVGSLVLLGAKVIAIGICQTASAISTGGSIVSCLF